MNFVSLMLMCLCGLQSSFRFHPQGLLRWINVNYLKLHNVSNMYVRDGQSQPVTTIFKLFKIVSKTNLIWIYFTFFDWNAKHTLLYCPVKTSLKSNTLLFIIIIIVFFINDINIYRYFTYVLLCLRIFFSQP